MFEALVEISPSLEDIADALVEILLAFVETLLAIEVRAVWADPDKLVTLDAILAWLALEEVTYPANAVSLVVSTLLINVTISAKESLSAWEPFKIASILPFSVLILPSNPDSIATLCEWAEPDSDVIPDAFVEILPVLVEILLAFASMLESIEELNAVKPVVPEIVTCSEPDINVGFPVTLAYATLSAVKPSKLPTPVKDPEKDPVASALVILGLCILILFCFYAFVML